MDKNEPTILNTPKKTKKKEKTSFTLEEALKQFEELKEIALNCFDNNGNPNISAAIRAVENKAKIAGLYSNKETNTTNYIKMNEITIDGEQLKLNIGEEYF